MEMVPWQSCEQQQLLPPFPRLLLLLGAAGPIVEAGEGLVGSAGGWAQGRVAPWGLFFWGRRSLTIWKTALLLLAAVRGNYFAGRVSGWLKI